MYLVKNKFSPSSIIATNNEKEIMRLHREGKLMDFLPQITIVDAAIMESWKKHFRERGVPYAITPRTDDPRERVLWKECLTKDVTRRDRGLKARSKEWQAEEGVVGWGTIDPV